MKKTLKELRLADFLSQAQIDQCVALREPHGNAVDAGLDDEIRLHVVRGCEFVMNAQLAEATGEPARDARGLANLIVDLLHRDVPLRPMR